eukprot:1359669-Pleurochrysis_carterae.AAC.2
MTIPGLEIIAAICIAVTGAVVTYIVRTRTSRVRLCCGFVECWRRVRRSYSVRGNSLADNSLDSR